MGEIVGAALVAHVPPLVLPLQTRLEMNAGKDYSIVEGLHRLRRERIDPLEPDTIVVLDTHWFTTFEWVVTAHEWRAGRFTSEELPRVLLELHATLKPGGVLFSSNPRGHNEEGWNRGRYGAYHDLETWRRYMSAAGFIELAHYYRPPGLPREQQPWLASVWRKPGS